MGQLIVIAAMLMILWIFLIVPQRRRAQAQRELHDSLAVGDEILTAGGVYGHVRGTPEDEVLLVEIAPGTTVRLARRAIAARIPPDADDPELEAVQAEPGGESHS